MSQGILEGRICSKSNAKQLFRSNRFILLFLLVAFWAGAAFYAHQYYSRWSSQKGDNKAFVLGHERMPKQDDPVNADKEKKEDDPVNEALSEQNNHTEPVIPNDFIGELRGNSTAAGLIVGPFELTEDRILEKRPTGGCDKNGAFSRVVRGRKFVVILHELSMTGAPISMMELATELMLCEANVSVVVLDRGGGLMVELERRKIRVVEDRENVSFKAAVEADLVIPGSAVCFSWIGENMFFPIFVHFC